MQTPIDSLRHWLAEFKPGGLPYGRVAVALVIGGIGAATFAFLRLPLPWMLGPMLFAMLAALGGAPVAMPNTIRTPMLIIFGAVVGASATPELLSKAFGWLVPMVGLLVVLFVGTATSYCYFRWIGRFDRPTAYFSAVPGGLTEMILIGDTNRGDVRAIALAHASRVVFVVMVVPFLAYALSGVAPGARPPAGISITELPLLGLLWFVGTCVVGSLLGWLAGTPSSFFLAPILVSTLIHSAGWSAFKVPLELTVAAQVVIGLSLGCRFAGARLRKIARNLLLSLGACILMLSIAMGVAFIVERITGHNALLLLLAYSPAGVAEMSLVAISLHVEVAFVVLHHLLRVMAITMLARLVFSTVVRRKPQP